uniref:Uncharacterized protein n=1 Tax=Siphoviridae sp. ctBCr48 TaxID=2827802 RepID=A0A8S5SGX9_9CAUD|nr:MAG TPA: hypothetical protein [Siphoviridae sp. ctBCr48]
MGGKKTVIWIVSKEGTLTNYGEITTYRDRCDYVILIYNGKIFNFQYSDSSSRSIAFTNDYVELENGKSYLVTEQCSVNTKNKIDYFSARYELTVNS